MDPLQAGNVAEEESHCAEEEEEEVDPRIQVTVCLSNCAGQKCQSVSDTDAPNLWFGSVAVVVGLTHIATST